MKQMPLEEDDKAFLKEELKQTLLMFFFVLLISSIILFGIMAIIGMAKPDINSGMIYLAFALIYLGFLFYKVRPIISELKIGMKNITSGLILDKKVKTKYLWTGNEVSDFTKQPKIVEHYFTIGDQEVWVEEKYYSEFNTGDLIAIHFSARNGRILKITQELFDKN